eukprot:5493669-Prymnesium_polylepis.1
MVDADRGAVRDVAASAGFSGPIVGGRGVTVRRRASRPRPPMSLLHSVRRGTTSGGMPPPRAAPRARLAKPLELHHNRGVGVRARRRGRSCLARSTADTRGWTFTSTTRTARPSSSPTTAPATLSSARRRLDCLIA